MAIDALSAPSRVRARRFDRNTAIQILVALTTLALVVFPIVPVLYQAVLDRPLYDANASLSLGNFVRLLDTPRMGEVLQNTAYFAVLTTVIAQVIGVVTAILVGRTDIPGRAFFGEMLLWPLFLSHLVIAFGWFTMYGPSGYVTMFVRGIIGVEPWNLYTVTGMGIAAGIAQAPLAYLYCIVATRNADPNLEDAARTVGASPFRILTRITLPLMRPAIIFGVIMNFVIAIEMLSIPLVFGGPLQIELFTTYLYHEVFGQTTPDYGLVAAASLVLLLLVVGLMVLQGRLMRNNQRFVTVGGKASRPRRFTLGRWRWVAFGVLLAYVVLAVIVILGGLILRSFTVFLSPLMPLWEVLTFDNYQMLLSYPVYMRSIWNTIAIATVGAAIGTVLIALVAIVANRSEFRWRRQLEYVAILPRAIPGFIAGIGIFYAMSLFPPLGWLRNTIWLLMIAYIMRYLPTGYGAVSPALAQLGADLDRSARTVGADWWRTSRSIVLPLLTPALFSCYALLFIHFLKEYVTAVFLFAPGSEVIGTTMLQFWTNGDNGPVSALASVQILITVVFVTAARKILGVKIYG
ncbi:iron ABC transporter permease [Acuticoccus sp. M5D2P5]|uniref:ABC transporter permease n=1 Tax=Acuticoccus kalidii TaxID=2910977 RepID=UPI001F23AC84|nr:iron ABC transporter permease [Acuticoccus kalidii]MCF3932637.1 iron ABC transporter permease [Acuticoccus kalidii]